MDRTNHYEAAFEAYLQWHGLGYVAVDETRRTLLGETPIKSLDFVVFGSSTGLLVDVKGRRFPAGPPERPRRVWECWSTQEDVDALGRWEELFGPGFRGLLVFAYHLVAAENLPAEAEETWTWRDRAYVFRAISVEDYRPRLRTRSPRWGTVSLPGAAFRDLARPFREFTHGPHPETECPF
jgi:hypothetical protein